MSDLALNVTWQEILREEITHCRAITAPVKWHNEIIESLSQKVLGSYRPSHPDLFVIGTTEKPAQIGDPEKSNYEGSCRWLIENIALKPVESKNRFAVIMCADKLNKNAANSLLKLSEEPPGYAYILFLMEDSRLFLPTLRSRSRYSVLISNEEREIHKIPSNEQEWLEWLAKSYKSDVELIIKDLEAWTNYALSKNLPCVSIIERLRIIAAKKNLSSAMLCDIIIMTLINREEKIYECIFNDLW